MECTGELDDPIYCSLSVLATFALMFAMIWTFGTAMADLYLRERAKMKKEAANEKCKDGSNEWESLYQLIRAWCSARYTFADIRFASSTQCLTEKQTSVYYPGHSHCAALHNCFLSMLKILKYFLWKWIWIAAILITCAVLPPFRPLFFLFSPPTYIVVEQSIDPNSVNLKTVTIITDIWVGYKFFKKMVIATREYAVLVPEYEIERKKKTERVRALENFLWVKSWNHPKREYLVEWP